MIEYLSRHFQTIDDKGRVILPGKLRRVAEAETGCFDEKITFYMKDYDGGLSLYTEPVWRPMRDHYRTYSDFNPAQRQAKRKFFMGAETVKCDRQGRITIPQASREKADLTHDVVIIGVGDHIEIWNEERFRRLDAATDVQEYVEPKGAAPLKEASADGSEIHEVSS